MLTKSYLPALAWGFVILILTLVPPQALPKVPQWNLLSFDSLAHAFVFMVWSFLLLFGSARASFRRFNTWGTFLAAVSYGAIIELLQGLMRLGRHPDWKDIVCNTVGAVLGIVLFYTVSNARKF